MTQKKILKHIIYRGKEYHLLDIQWSKKNADLAAQILAARGPKNAKYIIQHDTEIGSYGIYTSSKVTVARAVK